ncbi:MAG: 2-(1,2-epoxy,2-dihydrophenyl)acetyl-CoA isomerase [Acidobacteriota bacterium]|jgi:2-(1,2-epoxy-1,2-dihydrophenyl)acetyl-CoA isomerase|nr:2-(1,2-epoxy,2-dihydrophenyl)acetyl-CoA isomerase [Acidobacteriota bacterium]
MHITTTYEAGIATVTLNRPEKLNAFSGHMRRDLAEALEHAGSDADVRVVVLVGAGRAFCAGADVEYMDELMRRDDADEFARLLGAGRRVVHAIRQMTKPVVASVNGAAYGAGFNLALACDMRIAAESATFSQSFVKVGLHPDWGGSYFLPRALPTNLACEMFFLGDAIDARRAFELGLVNRVVADAELTAETRKLSERLRAAPQQAIAAAKHAVYMSEAASLDRMLQYETEAQLQCFESRDARERVRAFLERRTPRVAKP